jgi:hypothetical protein
VATQQRQPAESVRIQSVDRAVDLLLALAAAPPAAATETRTARWRNSRREYWFGVLMGLPLL